MHKKLVNCDTHIDDLVNSIKSSIKNKTPFSYVRLGDGEIQFLKLPEHCRNSHEDDIHCEVFAAVFNRHGKKYSRAAHLDSLFIHKIQKIVLRAINSSDYLGMFTFKEVLDRSAYMGLNDRYVPSEIVLDYHKINLDKLNICSPLHNRDPELGNIDNFKELISDERFTIMTDMAKELSKNQKFQDTFGDNVDFISVKHKHSSTDKTYYQREYIRSQFKNIKTHVVVYALGGPGKDFCSELKNDWGKCVIDMGSTVDAWAGSISRPSFGNKFSHCLTVPIDEGKLKNTDIIMDLSST
jgi:hypothetical protein